MSFGLFGINLVNAYAALAIVGAICSIIALRLIKNNNKRVVLVVKKDLEHAGFTPFEGSVVRFRRDGSHVADVHFGTGCIPIVRTKNKVLVFEPFGTLGEEQDVSHVTYESLVADAQSLGLAHLLPASLENE